MRNGENEFYLAYATHLRDQHRQLYTCLERVEQLWQRHGQKGVSREKLMDRLIDLREELVHHLAQEADGGCLEEAVIHTPRLSDAATELEHEDPQLLAQFDELISRLRTTPRSIKKIEKDYLQLVKRLCEHSAAESRIVAESFGMEVD